MTQVKVIRNVLRANDTIACENRAKLNAAGVLALNIVSAPGSGKTSLLEATIPALTGKRCAVLVGDLQTSRDAERVAGLAVEAIQINTGRGCHLSAEQVAEGLAQLDLDSLDYVFIENIGNMVCPAGFDLGEHQRVVLLSVPEGDDKVAKYPTLFQSANVILLNKCDLLQYLDFNLDRVTGDLAQINTAAPLLQLAARTGTGMESWLQWLTRAQKEQFA